MLKDPRALEWKYGKLPSVDQVPYDQLILVYSEDFVGLIYPWGDSLNYLRWYCVSDISAKDIWYVVLRDGAESRPDYIITYSEWIEKLYKDNEPISER